MTKKDKHATPVIFRMIEGQVIALFPTQAATTNANACGSYMHIGQHGAASVFLSDTCRLAKLKEYMPLKRELEGRGYKLRVIKAMCKAHTYERLKQIKQHERARDGSQAR